ncbi:F0F1 ATP synthase subunit epsilon [Nesterenkonia natronophila]|uniref:F0F1 ATP synthase subunit epsilon n=1 Tax=Nesterenkonia natronophila TaxID=2174932 RepID=A0A3A4EZN8_9MICC|nr:F0F1 ATP synthase subunit epsilon [Nesterenkonia natronophila]RJN31392.1 F0F1 ATP synthase subunit epsilon [Nesterenkonia natronophila]
MATLDVQVVAADHAVWSGEARSLTGRTVEGDIGILPGHSPFLALLAQGDLTIEPVEGPTVKAYVKGGFFSVDSDKITVVADEADVTD